MKKIAIDLDGVIFDSENLYRVYSEIYDNDVLNSNSIIDNSKRRFQERYSWNKETSEKFYKSCTDEVLDAANIMPGADIVLNKLSKYFEFIIVTSRPNSEMKYAQKHFDKLGLSNAKIFIDDHEKINRFISESVDYIIDDDEEICKNAASNNIKALYLKNNASNKIDYKNVVNVNNWGEIYRYLKNEEH